MRRRAVETAKFHFFDPGVVRALRRLPRIRETSADFGEFFEHYPDDNLLAPRWGLAADAEFRARLRLVKRSSPEPLAGLWPSAR